MQYAVLTSIEIKGFNKYNEEHPELTKEGHYMYRITKKDNMLLIWYDSAKQGFTTTSLNACRMAGNSIVNLYLDEPVDNAKDDFKNTELLMREIIDNTPSPVTTTH